MSFTIIGELINTTRREIQKAVAKRDAEFLQKLTGLQEDAGAEYIDINAGAGIQNEKQDMQWLISTVQSVARVPLCIDSPDPDVLASAWDILDKPPMINSISLEKNRLNPMLNILKERKCQVVALCMDDTGMPQTSDQICLRAERLTNALVSIGFSLDAIWIDPLVGPVSTHNENGVLAFRAVADIKERIPGVHTVCGLSNISFGLPARGIINRMFLALMMNQGLDAALLNPLDQTLMAALTTTRMLMGQDDYCMGFMDDCTAGKIQA